MKCIDFFTEGVTTVETLDEFLNSTVGKYLQTIFGEFEYIETPYKKLDINFIHVLKGVNGLMIFDNIFTAFTKAIDHLQVGYLFPKKYKYLITEGQMHEAAINPVGTSLARLGYGVTWRPQTEYLLQELRKQKWMPIPKTVFDSEKNYDVIEEYAADQQITLPFLKNEIHGYHHMTSHTFTDNKLISNCLPNWQSRAQRMTNGSSLVPHFDSDKDEPYLMSALTWIIDSNNFTGRELVCGKRSVEELSQFLEEYVNNPYFNAYNMEIKNHEELIKIRPAIGLNVYVNTYNPLFYHAVTEMKGDGAIYTIVHDCRMHNDKLPTTTSTEGDTSL